MNRYRRQLQLPGFGEEAQQKLNQARVLVTGAGGLGVPVLQYLTGMGAGTIGIVDGDAISPDNLHRQVLYAEEEVGKGKAETAAAKLGKLNTDVRLETFPVFLSPKNALDIIKDFDLVVDATDNFEARYLINDACVILNKPFVYGAIQQYEGHVSVFNYRNGPTYRCLYPAPPSGDQIPDCNTAGVLGVVPGIIGCRQALEAVKVITDIAPPLSGFLLVFDFLSNEQYKIKLKARPENKAIRSLEERYALSSCAPAGSLTPEQLYQWYVSGKDFFLLDVREQHEYTNAHLEKATLLPLKDLPAKIRNISGEVPVVTLCQQGGRSSRAARFLREQYPDAQIYDLDGGLEKWIKENGSKLVVQQSVKPAPSS